MVAAALLTLRHAPLLWKLGLLLAVLGGLWGAYALWENHHYRRGFDQATVECRARAADQEKKIAEAVYKYQLAQAQLEAELERLKQEHQHVLERIMDIVGPLPDPSGDDPAAADICVAAEWVRQVDAIR
jgi:hypothetical protein